MILANFSVHHYISVPFFNNKKSIVQIFCILFLWSFSFLFFSWIAIKSCNGFEIVSTVRQYKKIVWISLHLGVVEFIKEEIWNILNNTAQKVKKDDDRAEEKNKYVHIQLFYGICNFISFTLVRHGAEHCVTLSFFELWANLE